MIQLLYSKKWLELVINSIKEGNVRAIEKSRLLEIINQVYDLILDYEAYSGKITKFYTTYNDDFLRLRKHGIDLIYILRILEPKIYNLRSDLDRILKNVDDSVFWFLVALMVGYSIRSGEIKHDEEIREVLEKISNEEAKPPSTPNTAVKLLDQIVARYILGKKIEKALLEKIINNVNSLVRIHWKILGLAWLYIILMELGTSGDAFRKLKAIASKLEEELSLLDTASIKSIDITTLMKIAFTMFAFIRCLGPLMVVPARTLYLLNDKCLELPEICLYFYALIIKKVEKEPFTTKKNPLFLLLEEFELIDSLEEFLEGKRNDIVKPDTALEDVTEKVLTLLGFRTIKLSGKGIYKRTTDRLKQYPSGSVDIIAIDRESNIIFLINCTTSNKIDEDLTKTSKAMEILKPIVDSAYRVVPVIVVDYEFKDSLDMVKKRGIPILSLKIIKQAYEIAKKGAVREAKHFLLQYMTLPQILEEMEQEEI